MTDRDWSTASSAEIEEEIIQLGLEREQIKQRQLELTPLLEQKLEEERRKEAEAARQNGQVATMEGVTTEESVMGQEEN